MRLQNGIIEEGETYELKIVIWKMTNISTVINRESWPLVSPSFSFGGDSSWHLELDKGHPLYPEFAILCLRKESFGEYPVEYNYGITNIDGTVRVTDRRVFRRRQQRYGKPCLVMELSKLKQGMSELVPSDVLILKCILKRGTSRFPLTDEITMPKFEKFGGIITERFGILEEHSICKEKTFEWKISNISLAISEPECWNSLYSPRFSFENNSWHLKLRPRFEGSSESMGMWLNRESTMECKVFYFYEVKRMDGKLENFGRGIFEQGTRVYTCFENKLKVLKQRMPELAPCDVLTLMCTLMCETTPPSVFDRPEFKKFKQTNLEGLPDNFENLLAYKESCDTILRVQQKEYKAHKAVLMARSSVFFAMFRHDTYEKQNGIIDISDCDPDSFQGFLEYLYCGKLEDISFSSACHLYYMSEKYDVQNLKALCAESLVQSLTAENVCEVAIMADKYVDAKLRSGVEDFFNNNLNEISRTSEWECFINDYTDLAAKLLQAMSPMYMAPTFNYVPWIQRWASTYFKIACFIITVWLFLKKTLIRM